MKKGTQILAKQNPWQRLRIRTVCKIEDQVIQVLKINEPFRNRKTHHRS